MPKLFSQAFHAYIDYPVALGLIAMPFLLGLGTSNPLAIYLSVATGIAALILTVLTDHETGVVKILPYKLHLAMDLIVGLVFLASPFVLGFAGLDAAYYWVIGVTVVAVVGFHKPQDALAQADRNHHLRAALHMNHVWRGFAF